MPNPKGSRVTVNGSTGPRIRKWYSVSILRGPIPADAFTIISNAWLRDPALSWKAKGLLSYIASHSAGHTLTSEQMLSEGSDGKDAVRAGLLELERAGYLRRVQQRGEGGKIAGTDYILQEPIKEESSAGKPAPGADQQEQPVSAGGNQGGFSGAGEPAGKKTTSKKTKEDSPSASPRGARLPEDWKPNAELMTWYQSAILKGQPWSADSRAACLHEHEKFTDHWTAATGVSARKADWSATWRNWMRRAFERRSPMAAPTSGAPVGSSPKPFVQQADEYKAAKAARQKVLDQIADELLNRSPGMKVSTALEQAEELLKAHEADQGKASTVSIDLGYIEAEVIDVKTQPEVEGS